MTGWKSAQIVIETERRTDTELAFHPGLVLGTRLFLDILVVLDGFGELGLDEFGLLTSDLTIAAVETLVDELLNAGLDGPTLSPSVLHEVIEISIDTLSLDLVHVVEGSLVQIVDALHVIVELLDLLLDCGDLLGIVRKKQVIHGGRLGLTSL